VSSFRSTGQNDPDDHIAKLKEITIGFGNSVELRNKLMYFFTAEKGQDFFYKPLYATELFKFLIDLEVKINMPTLCRV